MLMENSTMLIVCTFVYYILIILLVLNRIRDTERNCQDILFKSIN